MSREWKAFVNESRCHLLPSVAVKVAAGGHVLVAAATLLIALLKLSPHLLL